MGSSVTLLQTWKFWGFACLHPPTLNSRWRHCMFVLTSTWLLLVYRDRAEALQLMLTKCKDANVINFKLRSVLHVAVYEESLRCVDLLLKHSASINAQVYTPPLMYKDVEVKDVKRTLENFKNVTKINNNVCNRWIKNAKHYVHSMVPGICNFKIVILTQTSNQKIMFVDFVCY